MSRELAVLLTLVFYKLILVTIGLFYQRRTHDDVDFYLAGRKLGPLVAAISASASSSSAWTLLGVSGAAYSWGLSSLWLFPSCVGGFFLNWYVLAGPLQRLSRRDDSLTLTEVLAGPSGSRLRRPIAIVASVIVLVSLGTYVASQFQGAGKTFAETFQLSLTHSVLIGAGVVVLYTLLGGFWAVSVTDTLQGLVMAFTAVLLPVTALFAVGGPVGLWDGMRNVPVDGYLSVTRGLAPMAAIGFILGLLGIGINYPGQPHVVNRFMALGEGRTWLVRARRIAIVWAVVVYSGMLLLGFCGRILVPALADPEVVFVTLTNQLFDPVVSGVMLAAVLSAIMSTADSQLLVAASSVTHDLNIRGKGSGGLLLRSRLVVLVLSAGAVLAALFGSQKIFDQVLFAWAAMGCAFGPLLLVIVFGSRVQAEYKLAAIAAGFSLSVGSYYLVSSVNLWKGSFERVFPFILALLIALAGAGFLRGRDRIKKRQEVKYET